MINLQFSEGQLSLKSQILFDKIFCAEKSMFAVHSINEVTSKSNNVIRYSIRIALTKELYLYFHKSIKETLKISQPIVTTNRKFEFILIRFNWNGFLNNFFFFAKEAFEIFGACWQNTWILSVLHFWEAWCPARKSCWFRCFHGAYM